MAFHYGPNGQQYMEFKTYSFQCDVGNHYRTKDIFGPMHCSKCRRQSCHYHLKHYGCCANCWSGMSDAEKLAEKKSYRKAQGLAAGLITISMVFLLGFPLTYWLIADSTEYLLTVFFIGMACWILMICKLINYSRRKAGITRSIWQDFRKDIKNIPPIDKKSKKILWIVFAIFALLIIIVVVIASVIMAEFNARWD